MNKMALGQGLQTMTPLLMQGMMERNQMKQQKIEQQMRFDMAAIQKWFDVLSSKNASPALKKQAYEAVSSTFGKYSKTPLPPYDAFNDTPDTDKIWKQVEYSTNRFVSGKDPVNVYVNAMVDLGNQFRMATGTELDTEALIGSGKQARGQTLLQGLSQANQFDQSLLSAPEQGRLGAHMGEIKSEIPLLLGPTMAKEAIAGVTGRPGETAKAFGTISPKDYTPESLAAFQASVSAGKPDYSLLKKATTTSGDLKIGQTREMLIYKKAIGQKWSAAEEDAWNLLSKDEKIIGDAVIRLLGDNSRFKFQNDPVKRKEIIQQTEGVVREIYGMKEAPEKGENHPLAGKPPGRYRVDGREVKWDGEKEIP